MRYEWDANKNAANKSKHGIAFKNAEDFEWDSAVIREDARKDYGETRHIALGMITGRLHVMVAIFKTDIIRIVSLRKANKREVKSYEKNKANQGRF